MARSLALLLLAMLPFVGWGGARPAAAPAGMRWVGTHGIELSVPASWPDNRGMCGTPKADTVLWNEDGITTCLTGQPRRLSVVEFGGVAPQGRARHTTIGHVRVLRFPTRTVAGSRAVQLVVPGHDISVTVLSPHPALLRRIVASLRAVRVDDNGCPTRTPAGGYRRGARPPASAALVPAGAVRVVACSYDGKWLDRSNDLGRGAAARLIGALDSAPYGFSRPPRGSILPSICGSTWRASRIVARFEYAHGRPPVVVTAHLDGCSRLGASNGRWAVEITPRWVFRLVRDARYGGAFADPRSVR